MELLWPLFFKVKSRRFPCLKETILILLCFVVIPCFGLEFLLAFLICFVGNYFLIKEFVLVFLEVVVPLLMHKILTLLLKYLLFKFLALLWDSLVLLLGLFNAVKELFRNKYEIFISFAYKYDLIAIHNNMLY